MREEFEEAVKLDDSLENVCGIRFLGEGGLVKKTESELNREEEYDSSSQVV